MCSWVQYWNVLHCYSECTYRILIRYRIVCIECIGHRVILRLGYFWKINCILFPECHQLILFCKHLPKIPIIIYSYIYRTSEHFLYFLFNLNLNLDFLFSFYNFWHLIPSLNIPQGYDHNRRASIPPYPYSNSFMHKKYRWIDPLKNGLIKW